MQNYEFANLPTLPVEIVQELHFICFLKVGNSDISLHSMLLCSAVKSWLVFLPTRLCLRVHLCLPFIVFIFVCLYFRTSMSCFEGSIQVDIFKYLFCLALIPEYIFLTG